MRFDQFELFEQTVQPGDVLFVSNESFINKIIVEGQEPVDPTWTNQLGHAAFVDKNRNIQESSIAKVNGKWVSGILVRPLKSWYNEKDKTKWLLIMRITGITPKQIEDITAKGIHIQDKHIKYPIHELAGTLITNMKYKLWDVVKWMNKEAVEKKQKALLKKHNPFNTQGMYCIAFANHCYEEAAGLRLIPKGVNESQCTVGAGLRNNLDYTLKFIVPSAYKDYHKPASKPFDLDVTK